MLKKHIETYTELRGIKESFVDEETNTFYYLDRKFSTRGTFVAYAIYDGSDSRMCGREAEGGAHRVMLGLGFNEWWSIYGDSEVQEWKTHNRKSGFTNTERLPIGTKTIKELERIEKQIIKMKLSDGYGAKETQLGVELELEGTLKTPMSTVLKDYVGAKLPIQDVGTDGSVNGNGTEIRFNHPRISDWKIKTVREILQTAKKAGAETKGGSAGMHVHISHPKIKRAIGNFREHLSLMQSILYPINCRPKKKVRNDGSETDISYGVGCNIYHDQGGSFGTLEIRAWNATLDPKMFMARVRFSKWLVDFLVKEPRPTEKKLFDAMGCQAKRDYLYMLNSKENPHAWGDETKVRELLAA